MIYGINFRKESAAVISKIGKDVSIYGMSEENRNQDRDPHPDQ